MPADDFQGSLAAVLANDLYILLIGRRPSLIDVFFNLVALTCNDTHTYQVVWNELTIVGPA